MEPTIYVFGDPDIVVEALLALATIFNSSAWVDGTSAFGLGGNLAAAALIGLLGILLSALQTMAPRIDSLLLAFIVFAIVFAVKTDVNVEDVQTGETRIVGNVPIGVAWAAGAASGIAWNITNTADVALQRPTSPTTTVTNGGFLNPLKTLLAVRHMGLEHLDEYFYKSLLQYYADCVGVTMQNNPGQFQMDVFLNTEDPVGYLLNPANIGNWTVVYYDALNAGGISQGCQATAAQLQVDIDALTAGAGNEIERWVRRKLGTSQFNANWTQSDVENSVDVLFRGSVAGTDFLQAQFVRNIHNASEGWRGAHYDSDKAQYVSTLTQAFEEQRVAEATKGSAFLQTMLPLMSFFQFLFFLIGPFIAFLAIAVPQATLKTVGFYLLLGVWAFSWMPIATVINHYMQIEVQNALEFSGTGAVGTAYTSILGFDSLYNIVGTKIAVGSTALAWTPMIVGALLTLSIFGVASQAKSLGRVQPKTDIASPELAKNGPLVQRSALAAAPTGTRLSPAGSFVRASQQQREAFPTLSVGRTLQTVQSSAASSARAAAISRERAGTRLISRVRSIANDSEVGSSQRTALRTALNNAIGQRVQQIDSANKEQSLSRQDVRQIKSELGAGIFRAGSNVTRGTGAELSSYGKKVLSQMRSEMSTLTAEAVNSMEEGSIRSNETEAELRRNASEVLQLGETVRNSEALQEEAKLATSRAEALGIQQSFDLAELSELAYAKNGSALGQFYSNVRRVGGTELESAIRASAADINESVSAANIHGSTSTNDPINQLTSGFYALQERSSQDPKALEALLTNVRDVGGKAIGLDPSTLDQVGELGGITEGMGRGHVDSAFGGAASVDEASGLSGRGDQVAAGAAAIESTAARISNAASDFQDADMTAADMRAVAANDRALDASGLARAKAVLGAKMEGARGELDEGWTGKLHNLMQGESGYDPNELPSIDSVPRGWGNTQAGTEERVMAGAKMVAALEGAMEMQGGELRAKPMDVYEALISQGMTPRMATQGAYAAAGFQRPGAGEHLMFAVGLGKATQKAGELRLGDIMKKAGDDPAARKAAAQSVSGKIARFAKVGGPVLGALSIGAAYYMHDKQVRDNGEEADRKLKYDILEGIAAEGDGQVFAQHVRQNELSIDAMTATDLVNEYARSINRPLPAGNFQGQNRQDPAVVFEDVDAIRRQLAGAVN